jgi:transketolase
MPNSFGESGEPKELLEKYGMTTKDIIKAVQKVMKRK